MMRAVEVTVDGMPIDCLESKAIDLPPAIRVPVAQSESKFDEGVCKDIDALEAGKGHAKKASDPASSLSYAYLSKAARSKFVLMQVVFNIMSSFSCSLGMFYLLFGILSSGPYQWYGPNCLGVIIGSSLIGSPLLVLLLAPIGIPEAVDRELFFVVRPADLSSWQLRLMPFLGTHPLLRRGVIRHVLIGLCVSCITIPVALLLAFALTDSSGSFTTWNLIWFNVAVVTFLSIPITVFGLLGFAMEPHFLRVKQLMSTDPNMCKRLAHRLCGCIRLLG